MRLGHFRWVICALLLFGTTKNYMDRQVLGVLKTTLQHDFGWNEIDYSNLVFAFQAAYAVGMVVVGRLIDRLGTRLGYALAMVVLESGIDGARLCWFAGGLCDRARIAGFRRSGHFPRQHQDRGRMVPEERTRAGHGNFQCRHERRRAS